MKKMNIKVLALLLVLVAISGVCCAEAKITDWPSKSVDIVVPFAAGGNVDIMCRILAAKMEQIMGNPVTVLNKPGGGAVVGQTYALNQKADGHTLLALTSSFVTNVLSGTSAYTMDSIVPIAQVCYDPELIVVSEKSGIETLEQFIELAKTRPLTNSTPGFSTSHHIASLLLAENLGLKFSYVHTGGSAEQTVQLAGGHVDCGLTTYAGAASLIEQGKIKVLAVCAENRIEKLPGVPTMKEKGYDFIYGPYRGIAAPAGTPEEIVEYLSKVLAEAMASGEVISQFRVSGLPVTYTDSAEFDAMLKQDYKSMKGIYHLLKQ